MLCARKILPDRNRLPVRLTRAYALLFCASMIALSLVVYLASYRFLVIRQKSALMRNAELISDLILSEVSEGADIAGAEMLSEFNTNSEMTLIIRNLSGDTVNVSRNFEVDINELPPCAGGTVLYSQEDGTMIFCREEALEDDSGKIGTLTLALCLDREYDFLEMLARILIVLNLVGIAVSLLAGRYMAGRMLKPIGSMIENARSIDSARLDLRLNVPEADDELRRLALTINDMLDRVEDAFRRQGQFTQDASHELRTPLSVLQGNADLLARWGMNDPEVAEKCVASIRRQAEYMHRLVEDLLFLARGDGDRQALVTTGVNLRQLFEETVEERKIVDAEHVYSIRADADAIVHADENMLKQ